MGNISSAQLDKQEIDTIAQELKKGLKTPSVADLGVSPKEVPLAVQPAPAIKPQPPRDEGVLHLNRAAPSPNPEDTIFIDKEGGLHLNDQPADAQSPAS